MTHKDPYQILGVKRNATADEIKRAYRRLAKEHHPDRNPGDPTAEQRFKEVQAAYEVLGDPQRREQYDRFGAGGPAPHFQTWGRRPGADVDIRFDHIDFDDLSSVFEQFFQRAAVRGGPVGRTATRSRPVGADVECGIELTFEEAARGAAREIVLQPRGRGSRADRIEFRVPAGIADGQRVRLRGRGEAGPGGRGDLLVCCRVLPHPYFRRDGLDLLLDLPLSYHEAALGAKIEIPTLDGSSRVVVPPGTSSGAKLRLRGLGILDHRTGQRGDLLAVVRIAVPRRLPARARELIEQLSQELKENPREDLGWRL
jgi:DnaJ-class molecular chaperone